MDRVIENSGASVGLSDASVEISDASVEVASRAAKKLAGANFSTSAANFFCDRPLFHATDLEKKGRPTARICRGADFDAAGAKKIAAARLPSTVGSLRSHKRGDGLRMQRTSAPGTTAARAAR